MESLKVWGAAGAVALAAATLTPHDVEAALLASPNDNSGPVAVGTEDNDLIDNNTPGFFGAQIFVTDLTRELKFTFRGMEAGFHNAFGFDLDGDGNFFNQTETVFSFSDQKTGLIDGPSFVIDVSSLGLIFDDEAGGYLLPFAFATWEDDEDVDPAVDDPVASAVNGDNPDSDPDVNFFTSFGPSGTWGDGTSTGNRLVMLFDDNGNQDDDNHDDFAVEIAVTPLPAAAWFLITALGGLFGMRWLRGRNEA